MSTTLKSRAAAPAGRSPRRATRGVCWPSLRGRRDLRQPGGHQEEDREDEPGHLSARHPRHPARGLPDPRRRRGQGPVQDAEGRPRALGQSGGRLPGERGRRSRGGGGARQVGLRRGKAECRPFRVQDGVAAVPLYEAASACFDLAGKAEEAKLAKDNATLLRKKVNEAQAIFRKLPPQTEVCSQ